METLKPLLSICVPVVPNRTERIKTMISRLSLNKKLHPEIPFELIIVDGGATDDLKEICMAARAHLNLKYVFLPLYEFVNPAYPRNVGFRIAEGEIFTMLDADYWVGEHFVAGAVAPFLRSGKRDMINNGYVLDTSENNRGGVSAAKQINEALLDPQNLKKTILSLYDICQIPKPKEPRHIWLWAAPRAKFVEIRGYDEQYCKGWGREDDDIFYRFNAAGLIRERSDFNEFCCLHLWHKQSRTVATNHTYYKSVSDPVTEPVRNQGRCWGRMLRGGYVNIKGRVYNAAEMEAWIAQNLPDLNSYQDDPEWVTLDDIRA
ncbi:glycosyltransferase family 2 protein [Candidatus Pacearchaeota archaeon]|nr:glycosyltransferase family 2 protein [Candidatus Pacearchaeota archaeon]